MTNMVQCPDSPMMNADGFVDAGSRPMSPFDHDIFRGGAPFASPEPNANPSMFLSSPEYDRIFRDHLTESLRVATSSAAPPVTASPLLAIPPTVAASPPVTASPLLTIPPAVAASPPVAISPAVAIPTVVVPPLRVASPPVATVSPTPIVAQSPSDNSTPFVAVMDPPVPIVSSPTAADSLRLATTPIATVAKSPLRVTPPTAPTVKRSYPVMSQMDNITGHARGASISDNAPFALHKRPKATGFESYMAKIHEELEGGMTDKIENYAAKAFSVLGDVAPSYIVVKAITSAVSDLSDMSRISTDEIAEILMSVATTLSKRPGVDIVHLRTVVERLINEVINVTCGPFCTQPGVDFRTNETCPGFVSLYVTQCPCIPVDNMASMFDAPLFKKGVYLKEGFEIDPQRTIVEYLGERMEAEEFDDLPVNHPRRKHAVMVGNNNRRIVPLTPCGRPELKNYAARVRDCGKNGTANCQLFEDGKERLWLVSLDNKIYGGSELLMNFHDDGIDDDEDDDATFKP
ncbi:hypothetical protein T484DRAFT_1756936 [Baffinella frigidus]|nr:hypothetical protein T484DRAFT_1756936 [Cryptophyta sp. CCMP2293]